MICVVAMIVFSVLGIFSLNYRRLAYEAFDCVFRRVTLRKCESGLDQRLKGRIVGRLMRFNKMLARFAYRYFEVFSWTLVILTVVSAGYSGLSVYNFYVYGNCYGPAPEITAFCPLDVLAGDQFSDCGADGGSIIHDLSVPSLLETDNYFGNMESLVTVIQFGCYTCEYTKGSQLVFNRIMEEYEDKVKFVYINFPIEKHEGAHLAAHAAECVKLENESKFWDMHHQLFDTESYSIGALTEMASSVGINVSGFDLCLFDSVVHAKVTEEFERGINSGVKGTPTFFVNDRTHVGDIKYATLKYLIDEELNKLE